MNDLNQAGFKAALKIYLKNISAVCVFVCILVNIECP